MTKLNASTIIDDCRRILKEQELSPSIKTPFEKLIKLAESLLVRVNVNSSNSSKPPSQDPNRKRRTTTIVPGDKRKPGGQNGHIGSFLKPVDNPTDIEELYINREFLPPGTYEHERFESRQVFDVEVSLKVTEYRAEVLVNEKGEEFVAQFPEGVTEQAQYGNSVKTHSTYMSQFQLIPLGRVQDYFYNLLNLHISKGSVFNWNLKAYEKLEGFDEWARQQLIKADCNNADETGINIGGKRYWLHCISNNEITLFHPDTKRGQEAMERMGILPNFNGILVHDHWKPYFTYTCTHALCNAHHLRELEAAIEDKQNWAGKIRDLLLEMRKEVEDAGGSVSEERADSFHEQYNKILTNADSECPRAPNSRKQSKSRNLLERLQKFEKETLLFLEDERVPFSNNRGENDIRMNKVQQKISGCFRSMLGAKIFCRIRSYISTCQKNGIGPVEALRLLFEGRLPSFMTS